MEWPRRKNSLRKQGWDYASTGHYFITICTWSRRPLCGELINDQVEFSDFGKICCRRWTELPNRLDCIELGPFVMMPDHFHAIVGLPQDSTLTLGNIVRRFKALTTQEIRQSLKEPQLRVWQRGYYDRIIRDRTEYDLTAQYILMNPQRANPPSWLQPPA
jgi:REP element-mobilizing transposase RayT